MKHISQVSIPKKAACEDIPMFFRQTILLVPCVAKQQAEEAGKA